MAASALVDRAGILLGRTLARSKRAYSSSAPSSSSSRGDWSAGDKDNNDYKSQCPDSSTARDKRERQISCTATSCPARRVNAAVLLPVEVWCNIAARADEPALASVSRVLRESACYAAMRWADEAARSGDTYSITRACGRTDSTGGCRLMLALAPAITYRYETRDRGHLLRLSAVNDLLVGRDGWDGARKILIHQCDLANAAELCLRRGWSVTSAALARHLLPIECLGLLAQSIDAGDQHAAFAYADAIARTYPHAHRAALVTCWYHARQGASGRAECAELQVASRSAMADDHQWRRLCDIVLCAAAQGQASLALGIAQRLARARSVGMCRLAGALAIMDTAAGMSDRHIWHMASRARQYCRAAERHAILYRVQPATDADRAHGLVDDAIAGAGESMCACPAGFGCVSFVCSVAHDVTDNIEEQQTSARFTHASKGGDGNDDIVPKTDTKHVRDDESDNDAHNHGEHDESDGTECDDRFDLHTCMSCRHDDTSTHGNASAIKAVVNAMEALGRGQEGGLPPLACSAYECARNIDVHACEHVSDVIALTRDATATLGGRLPFNLKVDVLRSAIACASGASLLCRAADESSQRAAMRAEARRLLSAVLDVARATGECSRLASAGLCYAAALGDAWTMSRLINAIDAAALCGDPMRPDVRVVLRRAYVACAYKTELWGDAGRRLARPLARLLTLAGGAKCKLARIIRSAVPECRCVNALTAVAANAADAEACLAVVDDMMCRNRGKTKPDDSADKKGCTLYDGGAERYCRQPPPRVGVDSAEEQ